MMYDRDIRDRLPLPIVPAVHPGAVDVVVEPVRPRDLRAIARVQRQAFRPALAYGLTTLVALWLLPGVRFVVARRDGRVLGCAIGDRDGQDSRVINLAVDPTTRRQGVGTALLRALEVALPHGNLLLMVEAENSGAQTLYRQEGYLPVGTANDYYGPGRNGIWMQKSRGPQTRSTLRV